MKTTADKRMFRLINQLKATGKIRFTQEFADAIKIKKQNLRVIKTGKASFTVEQIRLACKIYKVDANYMLGIDKPASGVVLTLSKAKCN